LLCGRRGKAGRERGGDRKCYLLWPKTLLPPSVSPGQPVKSSVREWSDFLRSLVKGLSSVWSSAQTRSDNTEVGRSKGSESRTCRDRDDHGEVWGLPELGGWGLCQVQSGGSGVGPSWPFCLLSPLNVKCANATGFLCTHILFLK
jgi:hypothetical protein